MQDKKLILVVGATGAQGGSVARHLLGRGHFAVRALSRKPDSSAAQALRKAGAEIVRGDLDDPISLEDALAGCHGVFGVTNFWEHFDREYGQGKNLVDAVAEAEIAHFVFSSLPSVKAQAEHLNVPHFEMKAELATYTRRLALPATFVHVAFYYDNFLGFLPPRRQPDGTFTFGFPQGDTPLAGVAVDDVGGVVTRIFEERERFLGKTVGIVGDDLSGSSYAEVMSRVLGRPVMYNYIPREVFAKFGFPGAEDLADMFEFNRLYIPNRRADVEQSRALYPHMRSFEPWLREHAERFKELLAAAPALTAVSGSSATSA